MCWVCCCWVCCCWVCCCWVCCCWVCCCVVVVVVVAAAAAAVVTCMLPFRYVCPCWACVQVAASSIRRVRHKSGPMAGTLLLELCKTSKKRNSANIIRFVMFVQQVETQQRRNDMQKYCQKIHGHFGLSFPSRANVVKVTHLNVTGSEASISWESKVPWRFR